MCVRTFFRALVCVCALRCVCFVKISSVRAVMHSYLNSMSFNPQSSSCMKCKIYCNEYLDPPPSWIETIAPLN